MKYYKFTYLLLLFMLIGISCEVSNVELASKDASSLSVDHRTETEENREHPAEVPSADSWIMLAFNDTEINWKDVDNWYTNELPKWAEKPEYHNMKSLAISCLVVAKPAFLIEAEREKLLYYAKEVIYDEKVMLNIGLVAKLLESAKGAQFSDKEVAKHAYYTHKKYAEKYKTELIDYQEKYAEAYKTIDFLQHDRWGKRLYGSNTALNKQ